MCAERVEILNVPVDNVDMRAALCEIERMFDSSRAHSVIAVNPEKVMQARENPELLARLKNADLLIPDGIGVVFASRFLFGKKTSRVAGADLMPQICELASYLGKSIFLFGAKEEINARAAAVLQDRIPALRIAGRHHGYVNEHHMDAIVDLINESGAEVLFLALGSPRQEIWMERYANRLNVKVMQGVGGTFDVLAGNVQRAPQSWQRLNLEWLFRLLSQPSRIVRQSNLPKFFLRVLQARFLS